MTSALQPLASASSSTVLPVPKPPGMAALPPSATGNRLSRMRCPVTSGAPAGSRARTGRGTRTGQSWPIASSRLAPSACAQRAHDVELRRGGRRRPSACTVPVGVGRHDAALQAARGAAHLAKGLPGGQHVAHRQPAARSRTRRAARGACPAPRAPSPGPTAAAAGRRRCGPAARARGGWTAAARRPRPRRPGAARWCPRRPARRWCRRPAAPLRPAAPAGRRAPPRAARTALRRARAAPGR